MQDAAVVDGDSESRHAERRQAFVKDLDQFKLCQGALCADDVAIALGEFLVAAFAGAVAAPHVLDLVALERERQLVALHDHESGEGHREVVAQGLLGDGRGQGLAVLGGQEPLVRFGQVVPVVEDLENELVPFLTVFPRERRQVFEGRGLDRHETVLLKHPSQGVKHPLPARHGGRPKITCPLGDGRLAHRGQK